MLASGADDGRLIFWDSITGEEISHINKGEGRVWRLSFNADGSRLAAAGDEDGVSRVWKFASLGL
jgi:WD40 repeat protein